MHWRLLFLLSLFGLAMGIGTVFWIPTLVEPLCWLVVFGVCAFLIARHASGRFFVHGLSLGLLNSVWVTGAHVLLFDEYALRHRAEIESMATMPLSPRAMMAIVGPVIGLASGAVLGLLSLLMARALLRKGD